VNTRNLGDFVAAAKDGLESGADATDTEMGWIARAVHRGERSWSSVKFYRPNKNGALEEFDVPEPDWTIFDRLRPFIDDDPPFCRCQ
jgi:hypothetical protein